MKPIILSLLCGMLILATACKKEEKPAAESSGAILKTFYFKVDGIAFSTINASWQHNAGTISYSGYSGSQTFTLTMWDTLMPGTYTMGYGQPTRLFHTDDNYVTSYISDPGTLTIVSHDTVNDRISGTFNCTLSRSNPASTKAVTNGEFNIQY